MKKIVCLVFLTVLLVACQNALLLADDETCLKKQEAALEKLEGVLRPKEDLLLRITGSLKDKGFDPRKFPTVGADGTTETIDLVKTLMELALNHSKAIDEIDQAAKECVNQKSGPAKMTALVDSFSTVANSLVRSLGQIDAAQILTGSPFGGTNALMPKARDDILKSLGGEVANVVRDPAGCSMYPKFCERKKPFSALDQALSKLVSGNVAFNNPQRMIIDRPHLVEVRLSTTLSPSELKAQLTEEGRKESAGLSVGDRMSATLNGGAAFDVAPSGPQIQWISHTKVTTWTWNAIPKLKGEQYLVLSFDAIITIDGKDGIRNVRTLTQQIDVDVGWPRTLGEWFDFARKWFENFSWLWASILVPVGLFFIAWWRRRAMRQDAAQMD